MPRAKKTATDKKAVTKKKVTKTETSADADIKKLKASLKRELKKEMQSALEEALLTIEIDVPEQSTDAFVDMDLLREEIRKEVEFEFRKKETKEKQGAEATLSRSELTLTGEKTYNIISDLDGFAIKEDKKSIISANKTGAIGFGLRAPRTVGVGSGHFRANYPSEASIPSTGKNSTRGVIIEGDGDDNNSYVFRALSRGSRQGLNITSAGNLTLGDMHNDELTRVKITNNGNDNIGLDVINKSKYFSGTALNIQTEGSEGRQYNYVECKSRTGEGKLGIPLFKVDGEGTVYTETGVFSNRTGYAELFEWADGNKKNENRNGFCVATNEKGFLVPATEEDDVIGVVTESAAIVGNAGWNTWKNKFYYGEDKEAAKVKYKIVEWEDEVGVLHSYYLNSLDKEFALPDNAIIYETDENGSDMFHKQINDMFDPNQEYLDRRDRGWAVVSMIGTTNLWKGQIVNPNWIKVKDINDDLEQWILR
jgi:hypothetical protein